MNANELLTQALNKVESNSIKAWVNTPHNFPIWLQLAEKAVKNSKGFPDVNRFTAFIVITAMG